MLKGAGQTRGIMAMMIVFGFMVECVVCTDALAAIFMVHRQGLGKVRHIDLQYLWLQKDVLEGKLGVVKIGASANPVDLMTKYLRSEVASALGDSRPLHGNGPRRQRPGPARRQEP